MESTNYQQMRTALTRWVDLPDDAWLLMKQIFREIRVPRLGFAKNPGDQHSLVVFVCSGLLRYFSGAFGEKPVNKLFLWENMLLSPVFGCSLSSEGVCGIQALEPTVALVADATEFSNLYEQHPVFDRLGRELSTWWLGQNRTLTFQKLTATERYQLFVREYPDLLQRVPQTHIASYLGITEVSLSRIRREIAQPSRNRPTESSALLRG